MVGEVLSEFDVIVIGGGINGLTTAAYLAKTGLSVAVIERRDQLGTHAVTEEHSVPGFRISSHATAMWVGHSPCMMDLELEKFGLNLVAPRIARIHPFVDGKVFVPDVWDANIFYKKWLKFSQKDAKVFKDLVNAFVPFRADLMQEFFFSPPSPEGWDLALKAYGSLPHIPEDFWDMTGLGLADYLFESDHIKAAVTAGSNAIGLPPHHRLISPIAVILSSTAVATQQALGGAHQVPHSLFRCIIAYGGKILQSCEVEKIVVEDGEAKGIILSRDSAYPAKKIIARKAIVSDLSPVPTFMDLVGEDYLDRKIARVIKSYDYGWTTLFTAAYLTTEPPRWKSASFDPDALKAWSFNVGADTLEDVEDMVSDIICDRIPDPIRALGGDFVLTMHDKTAAPPGYHNVQLWADVPYSIRKLGGPQKWDEIKDDIVDRLTERMEEYVLGFRKTIKASVGITPLDIYRKNPSAIKGNPTGGMCAPGQAYFDRPFLGCNAPRTPIRRLYLSNGGWPWNQSWLATGYIAACVILDDLEIDRPDWWKHKPLEWFRSWAEKKGISVNMTVTQ